MARQPTGQVIDDPRRPGVYGLRFPAYGKRRYIGLGKCTPADAEARLRHILRRRRARAAAASVRRSRSPRRRARFLRSTSSRRSGSSVRSWRAASVAAVSRRRASRISSGG